jgi:hypothetical protein
MIFNNYRERVKEADAAAWFALWPAVPVDWEAGPGK